MTGFGFDPFGASPFGGPDAPIPAPPVTLPGASPTVRRGRVLVHVGNFLTGEITATIPVVSASWTDELNGAGSIQATVTADVVQEFNLRQATHGARSFLAVERDGRMKAAGPIWGRAWDWRSGQATLVAAGFWSWLDKRIILPTTLRTPLQTTALTIADKSLGGLARGLVADCISSFGSEAPVVLPDDEAGIHTESWPLWSLPRYGEQLRQITQRETDAPDIAFRPRRRADDPRFIEWVMLVGTEASPSLSQGGPDWVFDASAPKSPVLGVATDEDATAMGSGAWVTGNGMEEDILLAHATTNELLNLGWPLTELDESRSTVEVQSTLQGHANNLRDRSARPVEVFKVTVQAEGAAEVQAGDFARVVTKGDPWLGDMDRTMRVSQVSGDMSDAVSMDMFPMAALL